MISRIATPYSAQTTADGIIINSLMPGAIRTGLQRYVTDDELNRLRAATGSSAPAWQTPQQGAATSVLRAVSPPIDGNGGKYFEDCKETLPNQPGTRRGVATHALDPEAASGLWQVSAETVGA